MSSTDDEMGDDEEDSDGGAEKGTAKQRKKRPSAQQCGRKPVEQLSLETGEVLQVFRSKTEAAASVGMTIHSLHLDSADACTEHRGFYWRHQGSNATPPARAPLISKSRKPVEQICLKTGAVLNRFTSVADAAHAVQIKAPSISAICNGWKGHLSAAGFGWRFSANLVQDDPHVHKKPQMAKRKAEREKELPLSKKAKGQKRTDPGRGSGKGKGKAKRNSTPRVRKQSRPESSAMLYGREVVGQDVEVYNASERQWETGVVRSFDRDAQEHAVQFAGCDRRRLDLSTARLRWGEWKEIPYAAGKEECAICFEDPMDCPAGAMCGHVFCQVCISEWIEENGSCPMCRTVLEGEDAELTLADDGTEQHDCFRPVEQICMKTGKLLRVFPSAGAASVRLQDVRPSDILRICIGGKGTSRSTGGHAWRFRGSDEPTQRIGQRAIDGKGVERVCLKTGAVLEVYRSVRGAAAATKLSRNPIKGICNKTRRCPEFGGFFWRYHGDSGTPWTARAHASSKPVEKLCLKTGKVLATFVSAVDALKDLVAAGVIPVGWLEKRKAQGAGLDSGIGETCRLERISAYGFFWRYVGSTNVPGDRVKKTCAKRVQQLSLTSSRVLREFPSASVAAATMGTDLSGLCRACREEKELKGFSWRYAKVGAATGEGDEDDSEAK